MTETNITDMALADPWDWWRRRLAGEQVPMSEGTPHAGFYRMPKKEHYGARKTFTPVAYWPADDGEICCRIGDEDVHPLRGKDIWHWVGHHPVTEEAYREVAENGGLWPDEHELVGMGHNKPPEEMSFEGLRDEIEPLAASALKRIEEGPIKDQDDCDRVANLADRLAELDKQCEQLYKAEREPYDLALKALRIRWGSVQLKAESYKRLKYELITPFLKKLQKDAEEAAKAAAAAGEPSPAETRRPRAGTRGRATTLKTTKRAEIQDYDACWTFFKEAPDVKDLIQTLANRAVRSGIAVPGCIIHEETKAV